MVKYRVYVDLDNETEMVAVYIKAVDERCADAWFGGVAYTLICEREL